MGQAGPELVVRSRGQFSKGSVLVRLLRIGWSRSESRGNIQTAETAGGSLKIAGLNTHGALQPIQHYWKGNRDAGDLWSWWGGEGKGKRGKILCWSYCSKAMKNWLKA